MPNKRVILSTALSAFLLASLPSSAILLSQGKSNPALAQWRSVLPLIAAHYKDSCPGDEDDVSVVDASEITADGPSVALVAYCQSGPHSEEVGAIRMVLGRPIETIFRDATGKISDVAFMQGSSIEYSEDVRLSPDKKTIIGYSMELDEDNHISSCHVDAYVWNPASKTFDWNAAESSRAARGWCRGSGEST